MNNLNFYYNIYKNIEVFVKHRYDHTLPPKIDKEVYKELEINGYLELNFKNIIILFIKPEDRYDALNTITKNMIKDKNKKDTKEIIVIVDIAFKRDNLSSIIKFTAEIQEDTSTWIQIRPLSIWFTNLLKNKQIPKHFIEKDWKTELDILSLTKAGIPKIFELTDPALTWLGARAGDVVGVYRPSLNVGSQIVLREVI